MVLLQEEAVGEPPCLTRCWAELPAAEDADMTTLLQFMKLLLLLLFLTSQNKL